MHAEGAVTYQVSRDSTEGAHLNEWDAVMQCHKGAVILRHLLSNTRPPGTGHRPPAHSRACCCHNVPVSAPSEPVQPVQCRSKSVSFRKLCWDLVTLERSPCRSALPPISERPHRPPIAYDGSSLSASARAKSLCVIGWKEDLGG